MANLGIEIGNHTYSHPQLSKETPKDLKAEIRDVKSILNQQIYNQKITTFAYPFGDYNQEVIDSVKKTHIAARIVDSTQNDWGYNFATTIDDYYKIPTQEVDAFYGTAGVNQTIRKGLKNGGLVTLMYHSIFNKNISDSWWDPIHVDTLSNMLDIALSYNNETWLTTLNKAVRYHREKNAATLSLSKNNNIYIEYSLTDTIADNANFNHPLTINYTIPHGELIDSVTQNGILNFEVSKGILTFDAIPDAGSIKIYRKPSISGINQSDINSVNLSVYPNPSQGEIFVQSNFDISDISNTIHLFDLQGKETSDSEIIYINNQTLKISKLPKGLYFLKFSKRYYNFSQKILIE